MKIYVKAGNSAKALDIDYATKESLEIVINLGRDLHITRGMHFVVRDPIVPVYYGIIAVQDSHDEGSVCSLVETLNDSFWSQAIEVSAQGRNEIINVADNILSPYLPPVFETMTSQQAEELRLLILQISNIQDIGLLTI